MKAAKALVFRFDRPGDRYWGHDIASFVPREEGLKARLMGWCSPRPQVGDVIVLRGPNGGGSPYVVEEVEWCIDPTDMFITECRYQRDAVNADGSTDLLRPKGKLPLHLKAAERAGEIKAAWKDRRDTELGRT